MWTDPATSVLLSRRQMLRRAIGGFGTLALADLIGAQARAAAPAPANPLAPRLPMFAARAKRVIFLHMAGVPSQVDTFDPKPALAAAHGKPFPGEMPKVIREPTGNCYASPFTFQKYGQCGLDVSELFARTAQHADDLCVIRSMVADNINHSGAWLQMHTGEQTFSRPSLGAWLLYGLGTENQNLPGYVAISPAMTSNGPAILGSSFLPPAYQGTWVQDLDRPIANLANATRTPAQQRAQLDALARLNALHRRQREEDARLGARIASFELAYRMQAEAPEAFSLAGESDATRKLYGIDQPMSERFGKQCLLARRLAERGVRMIAVLHTSAGNFTSTNLWDQHANLESFHRRNAAAADAPIAGLLTDLNARGLLADTLVLWGGEFGRTPTVQKANGREHNPFGFTMWMAGGGVKGGHVHGATDDCGYYAIDRKVHIHDLHATILHRLGLDHEKLTYRHDGRDYRLTDVFGHVVKEIIA